MYNSIKILVFSLLIFTSIYGDVNDRHSIEPYLSGDTFRAWADYFYDELEKNVTPSEMQDGDVVFVKTDFLGEFFRKIHPHIQSTYVLITQNSDCSIPGSFTSVLEDSKLLAWFGHNVDNFSHPKLHPIPIGLANRCWPHGNVDLLNTFRIKHRKKDILLYMNFLTSTYPSERKEVFNLFKKCSFCHRASPKNFASYLNDLGRSRFVLSPRGNGLDCHRTWEALWMGSIPIVRTSSLDPLFQDLPVLVIQDWTEVNEGFLHKMYESMRHQTYNFEKLYSKYWIQKIHAYKAHTSKSL